MIRISTALLALAVVMAGQTALLAHADPVDAPALTSVPATTKCVIATPSPEEKLRVGQPYTVKMTGCSGVAPVKLRYGDPKNLDTSKTPACEPTDLEAGSCTFIPTQTGPAYSFSATDASGEETYSGPFKVEDSPNASPMLAAKKSAAPALKAKKSTHAPEIKSAPEAKKSAPEVKKSETKPVVTMKKPKVAMHKNAKEMRKRMLYDMVGLMM
ncbi:hypothetical protein BGX21_001900 [Mortierella sp. AD011]|nr:hypothetical protein BGX20_001579 [Mortierella sp. AD010]KAF9403604.1 hypothetical protein BGX21_001900 [Mortierella sp. AD011]